jgi:hypothetical protein
MTTSIVLATALVIGLASPSFAQVATGNLVGSYVVTGTDADGSSYGSPGSLDVSLATSGALEFKWDGGKYVGVGQVVGNVVAVATAAEGRSIIMIMTVNPDGSLAGKWWRRTDAGARGTELWKKM